ncbi:hypothetical protein GOODEAATRI_008724, partial [Goodea atripinnis]
MLEMLNLSWCDQITRDGIEALARGCTGLRALFLRGCTQNLCFCFPRILEAARCSHVTDAGFTVLARVSFVVFCHLISTDDGIRALSNSTCGQERLTVVELDNCPLITDVTLEHLKSCHRLERIELYDCQQVTRAGIKRIRIRLAPEANLFTSEGFHEINLLLKGCSEENCGSSASRCHQRAMLTVVFDLWSGLTSWLHGTVCPMEDHDNMEYFYQQVLQKDVTRRLQVGQDLIDYLNDPHRSPDVEQDKPRLDKTIDELTGWINSSNFKVRDNAQSSSECGWVLDEQILCLFINYFPLVYLSSRKRGVL